MAPPAPTPAPAATPAPTDYTGSTEAILANGEALRKQGKISEGALAALKAWANAMANGTGAAGLFTAAVMGAGNAMDGFQHGLDPSKITTFTAQLDYASKSGEHSMGAMQKLADKLHINLPAGANATIQTMKGAIEQYAAAADQALKLEHAVLNNAAATGNLDNIWRKAGANLENMGNILDAQNNMMMASAGANNISRAATVSWYEQLGRIPGALDQVFNGTAKTGNSLSSLTAIIKVATGTGQKQEDVMKNITTSLHAYGGSAMDGAKLTADLVDVAKDAGVEFDVVKGALTNTIDVLGKFATSGDAGSRIATGLASSTKSLIAAFREAGMSGRDATNAAEGFNKSLSTLTVGSKAFLSAQSGGPGGLLGALKIDQMMASGKFTEVQKMQQDVLKKMTGPIIDPYKAKTQAEAAQVQKQVLLLRQGPLGSMAQNDTDALKMLSAMSKNQDITKVAGKELGKDNLSQAIDRGTTIQEQTKTGISEISQGIDKALDTVQRGFSAGGGKPGQLSMGEEKAREELQRRMKSNAEYGAKLAKKHKEEMSPMGQGAYRESKTSNLADFIKDGPKILEIFGKQMGGKVESILNKIKSGGKLDQNDRGTLNTYISAAKQHAMDVKGKDRDAGFQLVEHAQDAMRDLDSPKKPAQDALKQRMSQGSGGAGAVVGKAARQAPSDARKAILGNKEEGVPTPDVHVTRRGDSGRIRVDVHVDVKEEGNQAQGITPAPHL